MVEKDYCEWCKYNKYRCSEDVVGNCDFAKIPMEKDAILKQLKIELDFINKVHSKISRNDIGDAAARMAFDKVHGVLVMITVLKEKFGMTDDDLKKVLGKGKKISMLTKAKLLYAMMGMRDKNED